MSVVLVGGIGSADAIGNDANDGFVVEEDNSGIVVVDILVVLSLTVPVSMIGTEEEDVEEGREGRIWDAWIC